LGKYTEKIKSKQKLERLIEEQKSVLKSHFEGNSEELEKSILHWEEDIGILAEYKEKSKEIRYSVIWNLFKRKWKEYSEK